MLTRPPATRPPATRPPAARPSANRPRATRPAMYILPDLLLLRQLGRANVRPVGSLSHALPRRQQPDRHRRARVHRVAHPARRPVLRRVQARELPGRSRVVHRHPGSLAADKGRYSIRSSDLTNDGSSTLLFLLVLPSFAALIERGFSCTRYPGGVGYAVDAGAAVAVWLLAAGESGLLVRRRQHDLFARIGAGRKYLGLVGRGG